MKTLKPFVIFSLLLFGNSFNSSAQLSGTTPNPLFTLSQDLGIGTSTPAAQVEIATTNAGGTTGLLLSRATFNSINPQPFLEVIRGTATKFILDDKGFVGINNASPLALLDVKSGTTSNTKIAIFGTTAQSGQGSRQMFFVNYLGNQAFSDMSKSGDNGIFWSDGQQSSTCYDENNNPYTCYENNLGGFVLAPFNTQNNIAKGLRIDGLGNVGIGIHSPAEKLEVAGNIRCTKIIVNAQWWDKVFASDYKLMNLHQLEQYIITNKHLPDMPTDAEVQQNGVSVGDVEAILLKKVEELTLYIIELNKKLEAQQKQIDLLNNKQ